MDVNTTKAAALSRAITYCANRDELLGTNTAPEEVVKVAETFATWLAKSDGQPNGSGSGEN